jgi:hypothetical protein
MLYFHAVNILELILDQHKNLSHLWGESRLKNSPNNMMQLLLAPVRREVWLPMFLANAGLKVCLLEAGPMFDPAKDSNQLKYPWESPRRGASTKFRPFW